MKLKPNQFKLRPETEARYKAEHEAAREQDKPRREARIRMEIEEAIRDGESESYIDFLKAKLS